MRLSVIIPVYNTPKVLLEHCLSSIKDNLQYFVEGIEILLINDGSTEPHIEEVLKQAEQEDSLNNPVISKWIKKLRLLDAKDKIDFKNRLLLKLHLYWIFLITERRERKKHS